MSNLIALCIYKDVDDGRISFNDNNDTHEKKENIP